MLSELCEKYKPSTFIFGATALGRDLAPRVMCSLGTGLTADAVDLGFDDEGAFVQTTPALGGSLLAHIAIPELRPQMVTVRAHVFDVPEADESKKRRSSTRPLRSRQTPTTRSLSSSRRSTPAFP